MTRGVDTCPNKFEAAKVAQKELMVALTTAVHKEKQMGAEITRKRFPSREQGCPDVSRGSARKKAQSRDRGETVTVSSPKVLDHHKSPAKTKHQNVAAKS